MSTTRLTIIAEILLLPPLAFLLLFAFGEGPSGLQHFIEVVPLLLLAAAAWRWPQAAGYGLAGIGLVLAVVSVSSARGDVSVSSPRQAGQTWRSCSSQATWSGAAAQRGQGVTARTQATPLCPPHRSQAARTRLGHNRR